MGYNIIVIARLPGIYGDVNRPCPRATPSDSGRFTAINPWPRAITITCNPSKVEYSVVTTKSGSRTITFCTWNHFNVSMCPAVPYNILTSNCGRCPTTTDDTEVTCTDVSTDAAYCSFVLIPTIICHNHCGGISPNLSIILLDVRSKGMIPDCLILAALGLQ